MTCNTAQKHTPIDKASRRHAGEVPPPAARERRTHTAAHSNLLLVRVDERILKERALNSKVLGLLLRLQIVDARLKSGDGGFSVKIIVIQIAR